MAVFDVSSLYFISPELIIAGAALLLLILGVYKGKDFYYMQNKIASVFIVFSFFMLITIGVRDVTVFGSNFVTNGFTVFIKQLILISALFVIYLSGAYYRDNKDQKVTEFIVMILLAVTGMMVMVSSNNLLALYMGLEMQSLALYVLASIHRSNIKSSEAGLKYFVLGAVASGILLYGCSLIYGFSGTIDFAVLADTYQSSENLPLGVLVGIIFVLVGLSFKISAVPFHMWTPDVYEGSPMPVTAFFAVVPKIAAMALLIRIVIEPFGLIQDQWQQIIIFLSVASMLIGALGALMQSNIKRLIAYSSIGHVGYMLVGLATASESGIKAMLVYLLLYMVMSLGLFACIMMIKHKDGRREDIGMLSGLSKRNPLLAMAIAILILSMAGIPPFAGFFGKFYVFLAAIENGMYSLAVIGVLTSVVAAYYYLRIIKIMYFDEANIPLDKMMPHEMKIVAYSAAVFNLFIFLNFAPILTAASQAAKALF